MEKMQFIEALFARAKAAGLDPCEVSFNQSESFSVQVLKGEILQYELNQSRSLSFRGMLQDKIGYASTEVLDEEAIDFLVDGAKTNAQLIEDEDKQFFYAGDAEYVQLDTCCKGLEKRTAADKIAMARRMEETMLAQDARIESGDGCSVVSVSGESTLINTLGLNLSRRSSVLEGYALPNARQGEDVASGMGYFVSMNADEADPDKAAVEAAQKALEALGAASVPSGKMSVLFAPEAASTLLSTFGGVFSAEAAQRGLSLLAGKEGEAIAADCVTLIDNPHMPGSMSSRAFDGEGVGTKVKNVIDHGVLTTLLHNLETAHKQGVASTGNACRKSSSMGIAPTNFYFAPGADSQEALLKRMGEGVMITELQGMHAGANAISGDFSLSARGFRVEGGNKTTPVKQITIAGNFFTLLKDIAAVGSDLDFGMPGYSRVGSPSLLVPEMSVAGK